MNLNRKIAIVTTTRAEYGLLYWLIKEVQEDRALDLQLVVGGTHLSEEYGKTIDHIEKDGFEIAATLDFLTETDQFGAISQSMGQATIAATTVFESLRPDIVVVLGDRYEILSIALAAAGMRIPLAHIHGGEVTEGALDDSFRHAITKLSHIHFPVAKAYAKRIYQLGEQKDRVFLHGAPGLDHLSKTSFMSSKDLEASLDIKFRDLNILCTYHPVTTQLDAIEQKVNELLKALDTFPEALIIFTQPNADEGGRIITKLLEQNINEYQGKRFLFKSLGLKKYLSLAKVVDVVLGNSSSGIIEVPHVNTPTVNVGERQAGRLMADSIIQCNEVQTEISKAIKLSMSKTFLSRLKDGSSSYYAGDASKKIKNTLKSISLEGILQKRFIDQELEHV
ncbi:MAG: UDP-N-acetylglucosamine 2-epimerase [Gammaproteobacteria bacterium]|nr:UDP-N-acetylglucosamine 2-epimerase [Gammaproteobacteria bacterium]